MTGTSSDVAFADAYVKGVRGFDAKAAYEAAVKNATVAPPGDPFDSNVGREGLVQAAVLHYTPNEVDEGVSWGLEGAINGFGIANMAAALARAPSTTAAERGRYLAEHEYFLSRARDYVHLFDDRVGFFQGKSAAGEWTTPPETFDPRVWRQGGDYTETDGWNFAFHAPQDGQGLANLYGGRDGLARQLDAFFATPETATFPGDYGGVIHEMREARDVRLGQWGASNQISHHIPYMYDYAGQPAKTAAVVREATRRLFSGSEIGQGHPGDEHNGELSAWYVFSALGFYPLQMGAPTHVIGSPLFDTATLRLQKGRRLVVEARGNGPRNVYVQGVTLKAEPWRPGGELRLRRCPRRADVHAHSGAGDAAADPSSWVLEGSRDGSTWSVLDTRRGEAFPSRSQTRPFQVRRPGAYRWYRVRFTGGAATTVAEVELLVR